MRYRLRKVDEEERLKEIKEYADKCDLLCANCHRFIHHSENY